ncbi:MAG: trigger factor [Clostridiales bacterium]|nr:trigger factor [Clostridiales bacterium]
MKVNAEKLEGNKAKITIEVPEEVFDQSMEKAFRQVVKQVNIHGFRKGKAPRHVVERMYGREILLEDAISDAVPEAFTQALSELDRQYECIGYPEYDVVSSDKGQGLVFTATYDMKPEVKLGAYKGMKLERISEDVDAGAVEKQLKEMQERFARLEQTEEPAVMGDLCTIDFLGKIDDVPFEGGAGKDHPLELGSNTFIPGFEEQLVGVKAGDELEVKVAFPGDYRAEELAGKDAVFEVAVKGVQKRILSDMDDEFAKDVSEFDTIGELRKDIEDKLGTQAKDAAQSDFATKAVEKAIEGASIELADSMISFRQDQLLENFAMQVRRSGLELDQYMQFAGTTVEEFRETLKERAVKELETELVLEAIAAAEDISAGDEDMEEEYSKLAEQTGKTAEEIKELYESSKTMAESLKFSLTMNKTVKYLTDNAKVSKTAGGILLP